VYFVFRPSWNYPGAILEIDAVASASSIPFNQSLETRDRLGGSPADPVAWVEVLVDCPGAQGLFTYQLPPGMVVRSGDILSVPFGAQQVGAIAIRLLSQLPEALEPVKMRSVEAVISRGFFPPSYWRLLNRVAEYYCTPLMQVVRAALPPGLLTRSQRRVRLVAQPIEPALPTPTKTLSSDLDGADWDNGDRDNGDRDNGRDLEHNAAPLPGRSTPAIPVAIARVPRSPSACSGDAPRLPASAAAQQLLAVLQASKTGDYSWQYVQRQMKGSAKAIQELTTAGWVESYIEPPTPVRPKQRQAVVRTNKSVEPPDLTARQQEVLIVLQRAGGELWLTTLLERCQTSSTMVKALEQKGYVTLQPREVLRTEDSPPVSPDLPKALTPDQAAALEQIQALAGAVQVLLHGVTGSGKTEVYLQAIAPCLAQGQSALVLVPEIGLTPQLTDRVRARFGSQVCVYHSGLAEGERYDTWRQMLGDRPQVVIGTRSAVFAPLANLGLIILDEEHDSSFKQDQPAPCYHARTVAQWRSRLDHCPLILGTATPALETWVEVQGSGQQAAGRAGSGGNQEWRREEDAEIRNGEDEEMRRGAMPMVYLALPRRVGDRPVPEIEVVDMRQELLHSNRSIFSRSLQTAFTTLQAEGQQGILFVPRRGHSTFVSCRSCGYVAYCAHCDVSFTHHQPHPQHRSMLRCHYCNASQVQPDRCPACQSPYFKHFGSGTQRVVQELAQQYPELRVLRFDSDTTRTKGAHRALLTRFANQEADLLVGTQMLTKGIDVPQVTLVGIVAADGLLHQADYRASERTFQVLTQVAGRCGRGDAPGRVILQTYSPEHEVIQAVQRQQWDSFVATELAQRQALHYPPYGRLLLLRLSGMQSNVVQQTATQVAAALAPLQSAGIEILGPAPAAIAKIADRYRWQLLLKCPDPDLTPLLDLESLRSLCPSTVSLTLDVDPLTIH
jgi:primosomal protein N' (replication factor Y) (superfamily II helicase)